MSNQPLAWKIAQALRVSIILTFVVALINLLGWLATPQWMTVLRQNHWVMSPFTAANILLLQAALMVFYFLPERKPNQQRLALALTGAAWLLVTVSIAQAIQGVNLGADRLSAMQLQTVWMSPVSAWLLWAGALGTGLLLLQPRSRLLWQLVFALGLVLVFYGGIASISFLLGLPLLDTTPISPVALWSAIAILMTGMQLMLEASCHLPGLQKLYAPSITNRLLWSFLPATALLIFLENWLEIHLFPYLFASNPTIHYLFTVLVFVLLLLVVTYLTAQWIARELEQAQAATRQAAHHFEALIERSFSGVALLDQNGRVIFEAPAVVRILGYRPEERLGRCILDSSEAHDPQAAAEFFAQSLGAVGSNVSAQLRIRHRDGRWRWLVVTASNFLADPAINAIILNYHDISENLQAKEVLQQRVNQLALLNEIASKITALVNIDELLSKTTLLIREKFGYHQVRLFLANPYNSSLELMAQAGAIEQAVLPDCVIEENQGVVGWAAQNARSLLVPDVTAEPLFLNHCSEDMPIGSELCVPIHLGGTILGVLDIQSPLKNAFDAEDLMVMETLASQVAKTLENARLYDAIHKELSERRQVESALRDGEFWLLESQRVARVGSYSLDFKTGQWTSSSMMDEIFGIDAIYDHSIYGWSMLVHPEQREMMTQYLGEIIAQKINFNKEYRIVRQQDQVERWVHGQGEITFAADGNPQRMFGTIQDITEQKLAESQLRTMLSEKEILLKEVHHRVKNNLQIVSSLLSLRSDIIKDPQALLAFQDCQNEVRAISLLHENLYQSLTLAHVDAGEYIPTLVNHLRAAFGGPANRIQLNVDVEPVRLELDAAIPCGLIVTELFTNAIKHAFPASRPAAHEQKQIWVELKQNELEFQLQIRDNGVGLPDGFNFQQTNSLGLQLIQLLTQQLSGALVFRNEGGACFDVTFPQASPRKKA